MPPTRQKHDAIRMRWANLCFIHWRADPRQIQSLLPPGLQVDTFNGEAFVGLVPFRMEDTLHYGIGRLFGTRAFYECNVRTYVRADGANGVYFISLDAESRLAVLGGRWLWNLRYHAATFQVAITDDVTDYRVTRAADAASHIRWRRLEALSPAQDGSLEHFLTERYSLFTQTRGRIYRGIVRHDPWPLHRAELLHIEDSLVRTGGVTPLGEPIVHATPGVDTFGETLRPVTA